ncbi:hypothetical protein Xedl_03950 [Xenorhabdus eapokensis]|uniref:RHS family protein n=2 Tax=Xenorhabdus eapokensis TaxID=1873482 RepID=A0A1Q5T505_9GAMM|nr:hypothetical protein Xedl_03950 [Xenorhabdus eapokensis]
MVGRRERAGLQSVQVLFAGCRAVFDADPIGLRGGVNHYAYVHNPMSWIDPLGLSSCVLGRNMGARARDGMANHHLIPEELIKNKEYGVVFDRLKKIGWNGDGASNGIFLPGTKDLADKIGIPGHWSNHNKYTAQVEEKLIKLAENANKLSDIQLALGVKKIQDWAK